MSGEGDYVPKGSDDDYDYSMEGVETTTKGQETPFSVNLDEEVEVDVLGGRSPDKIKEESTFRQPSPGFHFMQMHALDYVKGGKPSPYKWYVRNSYDGSVRAVTFHSKAIQVTFCVPGDERCTIRTTIILPPQGSAAEKDAYEHGFKEAKDAAKRPRDQGGMMAQTYFFFMARLGFLDQNGNLKKSAARLGNWLFYEDTNIPRLIGMKIGEPKIGKPYPDPNDPTGQTKITPTKAYSNIEFFSYEFVPEPPGVAIARGIKPEPAKEEVATPVEDSVPFDIPEPDPVAEQPVVETPKKSGKHSKVQV